MRLIVGLGNPGPQYEKTRHNAGFMVIDELVGRHELGQGKSKFNGLFYDGQFAGQRIGLLKPMTYMNRSGSAVGEAVNFFKLEPDDVLVLVDDIALPVGTIRLRSNGSAGGHNGLSDIECVLRTRNYPRLRIGIDPPGRVPQADYVLGKFTAAQLETVEPALARAADCCECWLNDDIDRVMTRFNGGG